MKRTIAFLLAMALMLSMAACGQKAEPAQTDAGTENIPAETKEVTETTEATVPAPTEPEWEPGIARASYGEVLYGTLEKGAEVNVLGQFKHYYVLEGEEVDVLVEQRFVRLNSEEAFETWTGYASWNTEVYDNVYMRGETIANLNTNKKVEVLEGKDDWLFIRWDDQEGYAKLSSIRKTPYTNGGGESGGGGGGGGGAVDGTGFSFNELSAWNEGWEVTLLGNYYGPEMETPEEAVSASGTACVLAENVETYITLLQRGDELKITEKTEEVVTIWLGDEYFGQIPAWLVTEEGAAEYESWTGYARWDGILYEEYQMRNEIARPGTNAEVTVLDELPDCYVVEYKGQIGYMKLDGLGKFRVSTGGGDDSSGGGGGGGSAGAVWTPPAM